VLELLQKFTEYAGFLLLEEVLTGEDGMVERSSKSSVCAVLHNNPFEVNDLEETLVKFDVGVDVNNDDTVEGVNAATVVLERFNFLSPFPDELSGN
jgi:hypothetical protein